MASVLSMSHKPNTNKKNYSKKQYNQKVGKKLYKKITKIVESLFASKRAVIKFNKHFFRPSLDFFLKPQSLDPRSSPGTKNSRPAKLLKTKWSSKKRWVNKKIKEIKTTNNVA